MLLPSMINGVTVEFGAGVNKEVSNVLIKGLEHCIKPLVAPGHVLYRIFVASAFDSHTLPSRHMQHKAVDISRINAVKIAIGYPQGGEVQAIVDAIQEVFESYAQRRENFGPHLKKKLGLPFAVSGHQDHIHLSVN